MGIGGELDGQGKVCLAATAPQQCSRLVVHLPSHFAVLQLNHEYTSAASLRECLTSRTKC